MISPEKEMNADALKLSFRGDLVGLIDDPYFSDGTWYGRFRLAPPGVPSVSEYIRFSVDWNERARSAAGVDASEFDRFFELMRPAAWATTNPRGETTWLTSAPVFFCGGDVSWA